MVQVKKQMFVGHGINKDAKVQFCQKYVDLMITLGAFQIVTGWWGHQPCGLPWAVKTPPT